MELIDTHCHLNDPNFPYGIDEAVARAREVGVDRIIVPGIDLETSHRSIILAQKYEGIVSAAVGIHPHDVLATDLDSDESLNRVRQLANHGEVVAIGEIGIDYHHHSRAETGAAQRDAFTRQLLLAIESDLPVIVHGREAYDDVLEVMKDFPGSRGVLHSFEAPYKVAKEVLDLGWLVSFTALVTYSNYDWLREVVGKLPLDQMMIETDSPYLPPEGAKIHSPKPGEFGSRGRSNEPVNVRLIAGQIAEVKGISLEEVAQVTTSVAKSFFKLR